MVNEIAKRVGRVFTIGLALVSLLGVIGVIGFSLYSYFDLLAKYRDVNDPRLEKPLQAYFEGERATIMLWMVGLLMGIPMYWHIFFPRLRQSTPEPLPSTETSEQKLLIAALFFVAAMICLIAIGVTAKTHGNPFVVVWIVSGILVTWIVLILGKRLAPHWRKKEYRSCTTSILTST